MATRGQAAASSLPNSNGEGGAARGDGERPQRPPAVSRGLDPPRVPRTHGNVPLSQQQAATATASSAAAGEASGEGAGPVSHPQDAHTRPAKVQRMANTLPVESGEATGVVRGGGRADCHASGPASASAANRAAARADEAASLEKLPDLDEVEVAEVEEISGGWTGAQGSQDDPIMCL